MTSVKWLRISNHPDLIGEKVLPFNAWRSQALGVANCLDPMKRSLGEIIQLP